MREAALLREARLEAVQQPPPQPVQPSHAVVSRDDPELDQLMEEARRALDDAL
jgi:hypothetical protein